MWHAMPAIGPSPLALALDLHWDLNQVHVLKSTF